MLASCFSISQQMRVRSHVCVRERGGGGYIRCWHDLLSLTFCHFEPFLSLNHTFFIFYKCMSCIHLLSFSIFLCSHQSVLNYFYYIFTQPYKYALPYIIHFSTLWTFVPLCHWFLGHLCSVSVPLSVTSFFNAHNCVRKSAIGKQIAVFVKQRGGCWLQKK